MVLTNVQPTFFNACMKNIVISTYVDEFRDVSGLEVVKNGGLVEISQVGHVLATLKLRWVDLGQKNNSPSHYFRTLNHVKDAF